MPSSRPRGGQREEGILEEEVKRVGGWMEVDDWPRRLEEKTDRRLLLSVKVLSKSRQTLRNTEQLFPPEFCWE